MYCIKCGTELKDDRVFCDGCLSNMEKYPVKPGTIVHLPPRQPAAVAKKRQRAEKTRSAEEEVRHLKSIVRWLSLLLTVALLAFGLTAVILLQLLDNDQNYQAALPAGQTVCRIFGVSRETSV